MDLFWRYTSVDPFLLILLVRWSLLLVRSFFASFVLRGPLVFSFALFGSLDLALGGLAIVGVGLVGLLLVDFVSVLFLLGEAGCCEREVIPVLVLIVESSCFFPAVEIAA